jgi:hypothetical protein
MTNWVPTSVGYTSGNVGLGFPDSSNSPNVGWAYTPFRADFDPDGRVDLFVQDSSRNIRAWSMSEDVILDDRAFSPGNGNGWDLVGSGDINLDGATDLFFQHTDGSLGYWLMDGTNATKHGYLNPPSPHGWRLIAVADFNNDLKPDLLLEYPTNRQLGIWYMNGIDLVAAKALSHSPGAEWRAVATGDFDRDGEVDLLWQCDTNGAMRIYYMSWATQEGSKLGEANVNYTPNDASWRVVATGDYSQPPDNYPDIVLQQKSPGNGNVELWQMNNHQRTNVKTITNSTPYNVVGPR